MSTLLSAPVLGAGAIAAGFAIATWLILVPSPQVRLERRRPGASQQPGALGRLTSGATAGIGRLVGRRDLTLKWGHALDRAGIRVALPEFILLVGAAALAATAAGYLTGGPLVGILLAVVAVGAVVVVVTLRSEARKSAFAESLDDLVQLMATNLRAGHSLLQSLDSVAREMDDPVKTEIARAVNHVRVGRDLGDALDETAERMDSDDFKWVAQAVGIHRQVGGNLADVLDTVGETVRERGQVRRQVKTLSAEGRLSAIILLALPVFVGLSTSLLNPLYMSKLTGTPIGVVMLVVAGVLMVLGAVWLRKVVEVKF